MEKLLESYELRLKLVLEDLEKETCKDQKKVLRDRVIYYRHFIYEIKDAIKNKKEIEEIIAKREAEKALIPCIAFAWGDCVCKEKCKRGLLKQ